MTHPRGDDPGISPVRFPGLLDQGAVPGGVQPRQPGPGGVLLPPQKPQGVPFIYPWWDKEMPGSVDFAVRTSGSTVSAANNATTTLTGFSFTVAAGNKGVLKSLRATVQNSVAAMQLTWTLLVNGSPVPGYAGISFPPGAAGLMVLTWNDMKVIIEENQVLTGTITETGGNGPFSVEFEGLGWQTNKATISKFMGSVDY